MLFKKKTIISNTWTIRTTKSKVAKKAKNQIYTYIYIYIMRHFTRKQLGKKKKGIIKVSSSHRASIRSIQDPNAHVS